MKSLTTGNTSKLILFFTIPMLVGNFFHIFNTLVDSLVVGNYLGKSSLAAIGSAFPVIFALVSLIIGISSGITIVISQYYGAKDFNNVRKTIDTAYIFLLFSSLILGFIGIIFAPQVFSMLNLDPEAKNEAVIYIRIYLSGIVFTAFFNESMAILRGLGDSKTPLVFIIITSIANILFSLLFIIVFKMDIKGAAYATVLSQIIGFIISVIYLNRTHEVLKINIRKYIFDRKIFKQVLNIGLPSGMQQVFVAFGMVAIIGLINIFGTDAMAAFTIAGRIDSFALLPAMNFSIALSAFVGQNIGAGKLDRVKNGLKSTLIMSSIVVIIVTIIIIGFSDNLMKLFTNDINVINIGSHYLIIVSSFYIVFNIMFIYAGILRGAGDTLIPMFITLFSLWLVRIPIAFYLSNKIGIDGIWWAIPIAWAMGAIGSYLYYKTGKWKSKSVVKRINKTTIIEIID